MKLIVAADKNWAIGKNNDLLCHLPGDLKYFKEKTTGKTVVMGRKTLESLPGGKPLPNRTNIVLTRDAEFSKEGCVIVNSIEELLEQFCVGEGGVFIGDENDADAKNAYENLMVMGGAEIYTKLLPYCDTCYITEIDKEFEADKHIPNLAESAEFSKVWESEVQEEKGIAYRFTEYKRNK